MCKKGHFLSSLTFFFLAIYRYSLIPRGSAPGVSVGHTCTFITSDEEGKGTILIVGGADPSGSFSHSHIINLGKIKYFFFLIFAAVFISAQCIGFISSLVVHAAHEGFSFKCPVPSIRQSRMGHP